MGWAVLVVVASVVAWQIVHLALVVRWSDRRTRGCTYYARSPQGRRRFKRLLRIHAALLWPILAVLGRVGRRPFSQQAVRYEGIAGPAGACSTESFRRAAEYTPRDEDVLVVTQMRSGTTWMQHLVYQVLTRGVGDLAREGKALNAVSPFLESFRTIPVEDAPLVGSERPSRIIKTHLPCALCPFDRRARYIYVARHPVACLASCADFVRNNLRGFAPDWPELVRWFTSDELMWWGTWVEHVGRWQRRAGRETNVLVVQYEDMATDLASVARRVAAFLDLPPLTRREAACIVSKCRLDSMRGQADVFEMYPPHLLQTDNAFFPRGQADRSQSIPADVARQVSDWCRDQAALRELPVARLYPDLAAETTDWSADDLRQLQASAPQLAAG